MYICKQSFFYLYFCPSDSITTFCMTLWILILLDSRLFPLYSTAAFIKPAVLMYKSLLQSFAYAGHITEMSECENDKSSHNCFLALARESYSVRHFTDLMWHGETLMRHVETPYRSNETRWDSLPIWWDSLPVRTQWAGLPWDSSLMDSHEVSSQLAGVF